MIEKCEKCNSPLVISNSENNYSFECSYCGEKAGEPIFFEDFEVGDE